MEEETVQVTFYASTRYVGSKETVKVEFNKEDWDSMDDDERFEAALDALSGLEIGWNVEDE